MKEGGVLLDRLLPLVLLLSMAVLQLQLTIGGGGDFLHPLILVPGSGGNQLEARLTDAYKPSSLLCRLRRDGGGGRRGRDGWYRIWFDPSVLVAPFTRCFAERMTLRYHPDLDDYRNAPGVETRVPHFASTLGLLYLDPHLKHITEYMATLVTALEDIGYRDGDNLFGAPYDFRYSLAAEGHPSKVGTEYLRDLKALIEHASASNGGQPVILLSHSLGGLFALHLLDRSPPAWRRRYVRHLVALSAPWGGTVQEMLTFASGYTLGIPIVDPLLVRAEQRSSDSNLWLLPNPKFFGNRSLVISEQRNYSASDMPEFLGDIGFREGVLPYKTRILPLIGRLPPPGVPVTCVVGTGIHTPETLFYGRDGFDRQPEVVYGDGDGTVNLDSLLALESEWAGVAEQPLKVIRIPEVSHTSVLKDGGALEVIVREIRGINSPVLTSTV